VITQEAGNDVNYIDLTTGVIPEIRIFDFADGMPFITPRYPHVRYVPWLSARRVVGASPAIQ
jgi:hypothetical protein